MRRWMLSIGWLLPSLAGLAMPDAARAQEARPDTTRAGPVSPDSADRIRAGFRRPPRQPPTDEIDVLALPFRLITFPLVLVGGLFADGAGLLTVQEGPTFTDKYVKPLVEWGLEPSVGSIGQRSGPFALSLLFNRYEPFFVDAGISTRLSQRVRTGFLWDRGRSANGVMYEHRRSPQLLFWGIGSDSREEDESDFQARRNEVMAGGVVRPGPLRLEGRLGFQATRTTSGRAGGIPNLEAVHDTTALFGWNRWTEYARFQMRAALDFSHTAGFQRRGGYLEIRAEVFRGVRGTDSDFHLVAGRAYGYLPLSSLQQLAVQAMFTITRSDGGEGIPFTHLAQLGDQRAGRAYRPGRYQDRDMAGVMLDWRYEIWRDLHDRSRAEGFVFFDYGGVTPNLGDLETSDLKPSYGFGLSTVVGSEIKFLTYLAFGDDGARIAAEFGWDY